MFSSYELFRFKYTHHLYQRLQISCEFRFYMVNCENGCTCLLNFKQKMPFPSHAKWYVKYKRKVSVNYHGALLKTTIPGAVL